MRSTTRRLSGLKIVIALVVAATAAVAQAGQTVRFYSIGNSLTGNVNFNNFQQLVQTRGNTADFGVHVQPGQTLDYIYQNPHASGLITWDPYGSWDNALPNYTWDAVTVEPFNRPLAGANGDLVNVANFVNTIQQHNAQSQIYVYQTWPARDANTLALDYHTAWLTSYDGTADTARTRDFFDQLMTQERAQFPSLDKPIRMIPVGEVLYELNERMHAGQIPGYNDISVAYADNLHMNSIGSFIVASTWYSVLYKEDPRGLSSDLWGLNDPVLTAQIEDAAWQVVNASPW